VALATVIRSVGAALAPVSGDEAYYWDCSRHLDWSYFDQPPLVIWMMIPFRWLFGESALAVRAPAILASVVLAIILVPLVKRLGGTVREALWVFLFLHAMPLFALGFSYASTDIVMSVAYVGAVWAAVAIAQGSRRAWWGLGWALGLGFLAKFSIVAALLPVVVAVISPQGRASLKTRTPWLAALLAATLTLPVWIWAVRHNWDNIVFQLQGRHQGGELTLKYLVEFLSANLGLASPVLAVLLFAACWPALKRRDPAWRVATAGAIAPFVFFGLVALRTRVGAHWGAPGLLIMTVLFVLTGIGSRRLRIAGAAIGVSLIALVLVVASAPSLLAGIEWEYKGRPNKFNVEKLNRIVANDWIAQQVIERRDAWAEELGVSPQTIYVASRSYTAVHLNALLSKGELETRLLNITGGTHGLASHYWHPPSDFRGRRMLFVNEEYPLAERLREHYARVEERPTLIVDLGEMGQRKIFVYRCEEPLDPADFTRLAE